MRSLTRREMEKHTFPLNRFSLFLLVMICMPANGSLGQTSWTKKISGLGLGNPFCVNPWNDNIIYAAVGTNKLYISRDRGNTWVLHSGVGGGTAIKSVAVSARDTNIILIAQESGPPDRIVKSTDNGVSWTITLEKNFYFWGVPLAHDRQHDDTVYTMGSNTIYRSTNFGDTWDSIRFNPFSSWNQGWEYAVIRHDSSNIIIVADNATGIWKSVDYGVNWRKTHTITGEVPALALARTDPMVVYGARWAGGGGFVKSIDGGETWSFSTPLNTVNMWGVDVAKNEDSYLISGTFGPSFETTGGIYISRNAAASWQRTYEGLVGTLNYACLVIDSLNVFVLQDDGLYKLYYPASVTVTSPNGGEFLHADSVYSITWTESYVPRVRIEYTTDDGSTWYLIGDSVNSSEGSFLWTAPNTPSTGCRVRIRDVYDASIFDQSDAAFTIDAGFLQLLSPNGGELFRAGDTATISWNSLEVPAVTIDYTTDNGTSWIDIAGGVSGAPGIYLWTIPHTPSADCRVRIRDSLDTGLSALSDSSFMITDTLEFNSELYVSDDGTGADTVRFGEIHGATDGIDTLYGESELPPKPDPGTFDVRWFIEFTEGSKANVRDNLSLMQPRRVYLLELQPGPGGYPFSIRWDPSLLPGGTFVLRDAQTAGGELAVDMKHDSVCIVPDSSIASIEIVHSMIATIVVPVRDRWNILSIPVETDRAVKNEVFPTALSNAFAFDDGYVVHDTLQRGRGYWMKFDGEKSIVITGFPVLSDTVQVVNGWNLIGSVSYPVDASAVFSEPAPIIIRPFFGFRSGYYRADTLYQGYGYWIKVNGSGEIILPPPDGLNK